MRALLGLLLLFLAVPAAAQQPAPLAVSVVRDGANWTAELRLRRAAPAWVFLRSPLTEGDSRPWRPQSWTILTPGVRLERRGHYDALIASDGRRVPPVVRIRFTPFGRRVQGDYDPSLVFSDGTVALYSEQFDAFPIADAGRIASLPTPLATARIPYSATRISLRDAAGPVLFNGSRVAQAVIEDDSDGTYILFGNAQAVTTDALALVVDPQLPERLREALTSAPPQMLERYARLLGPHAGPRPTIMASWAGPTPGRTSQGGSVLPGLVVMRFEGEGVIQTTPRARHQTLWFIAHEAAHFWLGQTVRYDTALDSWITEGGADLLAFRAVAAADPSYNARDGLQAAIEECVRLTGPGRGVSRAVERNEYRAYYGCGAIFALAAESASGQPFHVFVRDLIEANRRDRIVTRQEWLAALDRVSRDPALGRMIGAMLDSGAADPKAAIAALLTQARVPFTRRADGMPVLT